MWNRNTAGIFTLFEKNNITFYTKIFLTDKLGTSQPTEEVEYKMLGSRNFWNTWRVSSKWGEILQKSDYHDNGRT